MKRVFDFLFAFIFLLLLLPLFLILMVAISLGSKGGAFFSQERVGKKEKVFTLHKFRSMRQTSNDKLQLTVEGDNRITGIGKLIRKTKLDELPQLWNILIGDMSFIGPRPEVSKYVKLYSSEQKKVLSVRPGLSDPASLAFMNEAELLAQSKDPESSYINDIMPKKLQMNLDYIQNRTLLSDFGMIFKTIGKIFS